jgi:undecaprenyl-diphosphatase
METLKSIDEFILLAVNGWRSPWMDDVMWIISGKLTWFPLYVGLLILVYFTLKNKKRFISFFVIGILCIGAADALANFGIKQQVQRYRPSHHEELSQQLQYYTYENGKEYRGGKYGFVSGHATNSFAIAVFFGLFFFKQSKRKILYLMLLWAIIVSYSRMYLGVHYLSDLVGGAILGSSLALAGHILFKRVMPPELDA